MDYKTAKFEVSSFSHSRDIIRGSKFKNGSRDHDHAHLGEILLSKEKYLIFRTSIQNLKTSSCSSRAIF